MKKTNACKIYHSYSCVDVGLYIGTDMTVYELADIIVGLQFYIEDNTKHGEHTCITEEMAVYLLCNHFNCEEYDKDNLCQLESYDDTEKDLVESQWIDLYGDREIRCGITKRDECKEKIKPYAETDYIKKLCRYYDDDAAFSKSPYDMLTPLQILEKY